MDITFLLFFLYSLLIEFLWDVYWASSVFAPCFLVSFHSLWLCIVILSNFLRSVYFASHIVCLVFIFQPINWVFNLSDYFSFLEVDLSLFQFQLFFFHSVIFIIVSILKNVLFLNLLFSMVSFRLFYYLKVLKSSSSYFGSAHFLSW